MFLGGTTEKKHTNRQNPSLGTFLFSQPFLQIFASLSDFGPAACHRQVTRHKAYCQIETLDFLLPVGISLLLGISSIPFSTSWKF